MAPVAVLIGLLVFILPGFIASAVAARDRPAPATLTDLELILRALGYSLVIHLALAATTWTPCLVRKLDGGRNWDDHVGELALFAFTVLALAVALGQLLYWAFDWLAPRTEWWARLLFHAIGGQDVRDGFDYIFLRRKRQGEQFIVVVHGRDGDRFAGVYGDGSYFGFSPRSHDLFLEEMWEAQGDDFVRPADGKTIGGWFRADAIEHLDFRELEEAEAERGSASSFGFRGIRNAIREIRENFARDLIEAAPAHPEVPSNHDLQDEVERVNQEVLRVVGGQPTYEQGQELINELKRLGGSFVRALQADDDFDADDVLVRDLRRYARRAQHSVPPWDLWALTLAFYADGLDETKDREGELLAMAGLIIEGIITIHDWDWQAIYEAEEGEKADQEGP